MIIGLLYSKMNIKEKISFSLIIVYFAKVSIKGYLLYYSKLISFKKYLNKNLYSCYLFLLITKIKNSKITRLEYEFFFFWRLKIGF